VKTCLSCGNAKSSLFERAMGAFSLSKILTLLQTKHWAQNMLKILSMLSTNLGKGQLFDKVVTTQASLSSLQAIHGKEQLFNILHAIGAKVKHS
jgi:hypothetical protein